MRFLGVFLSLLAFANLALSQRSTACSDSGVCATLATSTSNNDVYIQISAPSSSGWAAVGIGRQMRGALMFVIYPNGSGGVTVSPRLGAGQFEPEYSNTINVEALSGSGIVNGRMVANIKCSNCRSWDGGSLGTNWIYARNSRQQITSRSTSAELSQHNDWGRLPAISLTAAQTTSQDPFANFVGGVTSTNTGGSTNSGDSDDGNGNSTNNGDSSSGGSSNGGSNSDGPGFKVLLAHAIGMLVAFVIIFPLGGFIIRVPINIGPQRVRIHYALQGLAYALALAAFGLIIWYCDYRENHFKRNHQKFGLVPIILLFLQFILGIVHHMLYKSRGAKAPQITRQGHRWLGRATIIIGLATTWTGIDLAEETGKWKAEGKDIKPLIIAFWVLLAVFLASWVAAAVADGVKEYKSKKKAPDSFSSREVDHELEERRQSKEYTRGQGGQRAIDVQQQRGRSDSFGTPEQGRYA